MSDKFTLNEQGLKGEGILTTLQQFSPTLLAVFGAVVVLGLLILRCRSSSKQSISGTIVNDSRVTQNSTISFWGNSEQIIDKARVSKSNIAQRKLKK